MDGFVVFLVAGSLLLIGGVLLAKKTRDRREKRRAEEAARTDGTPYIPRDPDQIPGDVWGPK